MNENTPLDDWTTEDSLAMARFLQKYSFNDLAVALICHAKWSVESEREEAWALANAFCDAFKHRTPKYRDDEDEDRGRLS
jgi:hypothetical protein